jgi:hypothetical protein
MKMSENKISQQQLQVREMEKTTDLPQVTDNFITQCCIDYISP